MLARAATPEHSRAHAPRFARKSGEEGALEHPRRMLRQAKTGRGHTGSRWRGDGCVLNGEPTCGGSGGIDELEERTEPSYGEKKYFSPTGCEDILCIAYFQGSHCVTLAGYDKLKRAA